MATSSSTTTATHMFGVSRVWVGEISDPPQFLSKLAQRIATLGGSYRDKYEMKFETQRQDSRHINFYSNNKSSIKPKGHDLHNEDTDNDDKEIAVISSSLLDDSQNQPIVPKNCLSILTHSKHNESVFVLFENRVVWSSDLLISQFVSPFKLKKRTKAINVNGECYQWGDFYIYFGQVSLHTSPADFVVVEIEYQCIHSVRVGNSDKILQEAFNWIITPTSKLIVSATKMKTKQTELEKSMDMEVDGDNDNQKNKNIAKKNAKQEKQDQDDEEEENTDVFVEMSNETKGEKIRWKSQAMVDFSKLDIDPQCNFDGRHLSALYCRAFSQITD